MLKKTSCLILLGLLYASLVFSQDIKERNFIFPESSDVSEFDFPIDELNAVSSVEAVYWAGAIYDEKSNKLYSVDIVAQKGIMIDLNLQEVRLFGKGEGRGPEEAVQIAAVQVFEDYIVLGDTGGMLSHIYKKETLEYVNTIPEKNRSIYFQIVEDTIINASPIANPFFERSDLEGNVITSYGSIDHLTKGLLNLTGSLSNHNLNEYYLNYFPAYLRYDDGIDELQLHILPSTIDYDTKLSLTSNSKDNGYRAPNDRIFRFLYQDNAIKIISHGIIEDGYKTESYLDVYDTNDTYLCSINLRDIMGSFYYGAEDKGQILLERSIKFRTPYAFYIQSPDSKIWVVDLVSFIKKHIDKGK
jgi:hypothetical protein